MKRRYALSLLLLCALSLGSCAESEQTAIVVTVGENFGDELKLVRYDFWPVPPDGGAASGEMEAGVEAVQQPVEDIARPVVLLKGRSQEVDVKVTAVNESGGNLVESRARARFIEGRILLLKMVLAKECSGIPCNDGETCSAEMDRVAFPRCIAIPNDRLPSFERGGKVERWVPRIVSGPPEAREASTPAIEAGVTSDAGTPADLDANLIVDAAQVAVDASDPCNRARGDQCRLSDNCGCNDEQTCRIPASGGPSMCVTAGEKKRNERCSSDTECGPNLTCLHSLCRAVCTGPADCTEGECLPFDGDAGTDTGPRFCLDGCKRGEMCGAVACVPRNRDDVDRGACLLPSGVCATNGICDEPIRGTGMCTEGSDTDDCCTSRPPGAACDAVRDCGCRAGATCQQNQGQRASCIPIGDAGVAAKCASGDCGKGLSCVGICAEICDRDSDCKQKPGTCQRFSVDASSSPGFCRYSCTRDADCSSPTAYCMSGFCAPR